MREIQAESCLTVIFRRGEANSTSQIFGITMGKISKAGHPMKMNKSSNLLYSRYTIQAISKCVGGGGGGVHKHPV